MVLVRLRPTFRYILNSIKATYISQGNPKIQVLDSLHPSKKENTTWEFILKTKAMGKCAIGFFHVIILTTPLNSVKQRTICENTCTEVCLHNIYHLLLLQRSNMIRNSEHPWPLNQTSTVFPSLESFTDFNDNTVREVSLRNISHSYFAQECS